MIPNGFSLGRFRMSHILQRSASPVYYLPEVPGGNGVGPRSAHGTSISFFSFFFFFFVFVFVFVGPHPWHIEVPRLGMESEL